ncbi:MAG: glycosyltransferase family 4 protein [Sphingobacteriaceae bacterium]|nr:glycosyltransferase family 4 protein [Cytophagaceae bacterium]
MSTPPVRVLIVHNLLWSHYKSALFGALHRAAEASGQMEILVAQLARSERSRAGLSDPTGGEHPYPHVLLFDGFLEEFRPLARFRALLRVLRNYRPDVVNLTGYYDPAQVGILAYCKFRGIRTILSNESGALDHVRRDFKETLKRVLIRQFDGFICFGRTSAEYLLTLGARPDQILTDRAAVVDDDRIRQGYEAGLRQREEKRRTLRLFPRNFIYVGRLISEKNILRLVEAFADFQKKSPESGDWGLLLLGEGDLRSDLQRRVVELGLTSVRFLPGVPWYEVSATLALANVLVLPSYSEPWGLVVNEAMICGLPVLVSERCGCVPDLVVAGQTGFSFDPQNSGQLAKFLQTFTEFSDEDRTRMGDAARQQVSAFSLPLVAEQIRVGMKRIAGKA